MPVLRARREKVSPVVKQCYRVDVTVDIFDIIFPDFIHGHQCEG